MKKTKTKTTIEFSAKLTEAIRREIQCHAEELGDELDGVEEVIGDNLMADDVRKEWRGLVDTHGFDKVTKTVKERFL